MVDLKKRERAHASEDGLESLTSFFGVQGRKLDETGSASSSRSTWVHIIMIIVVVGGMLLSGREAPSGKH